LTELSQYKIHRISIAELVERQINCTQNCAK
jgi:hypothetical protein